MNLLLMKRENGRLAGVAHSYSVNVWGRPGSPGEIPDMLPCHQTQGRDGWPFTGETQEGEIKCQGGNNMVASVR